MLVISLSVSSFSLSSSPQGMSCVFSGVCCFGRDCLFVCLIFKYSCFSVCFEKAGCRTSVCIASGILGRFVKALSSYESLFHSLRLGPRELCLLHRLVLPMRKSSVAPEEQNCWPQSSSQSIMWSFSWAQIIEWLEDKGQDFVTGYSMRSHFREQKTVETSQVFIS